MGLSADFWMGLTIGIIVGLIVSLLILVMPASRSTRAKYKEAALFQHDLLQTEQEILKTLRGNNQMLKTLIQRLQPNKGGK